MIMLIVLHCYTGEANMPNPPNLPKVTYVPIYKPNIFFPIEQESSETPYGLR